MLHLIISSHCKEKHMIFLLKIGYNIQLYHIIIRRSGKLVYVKKNSKITKLTNLFEDVVKQITK